MGFAQLVIGPAGSGKVIHQNYILNMVYMCECLIVYASQNGDENYNVYSLLCVSLLFI